MVIVIGGHASRGGSGYSNNQNNSSVSYTANNNSQGLGKQYALTEVLGSPGNTSKNAYGDSGPIHDIIAFCRKKSGDCWGSNALHHGAGGVDGPLYVKAINLGRTDMHDKDAGNLFYVLRDFNFNLDVINLSNNKLGNVAVESMIYGITCLQYQTLYNPSNWQPYLSTIKTVQSVVNINLSNNQIGDDGAKLLAHYLANGSLPHLKHLDVSGNQFSGVGNKYFAQAAKNVQQPIKILVDTIVSGLQKHGTLAFGTKEARQIVIKDWLKGGQDNSIDVKNVTVSKDIFDKITNSGKLAGNFLFGGAKCSIVPNNVKTFAADQIIAVASKNAGIVNTAIGVVTCYFETFEESASSQQGIQFMTDIGLVGQSEFLENIE